MLLQEMKGIIKYAIELDIDHLETFLGYEGDKVLKITASNVKSTEFLRKYLDNMGLEYKFEPKFETSAKNKEKFLIFVGVEDPSMIRLKKD